MDLALNNLQRLICHKTQQTKSWIQTPVVLLRSPKTFLFSNSVLNSIPAILLQGWIWHWIAHEGLYTIKQRKQTENIF